jgi:hypothetical protein
MSNPQIVDVKRRSAFLSQALKFNTLLVAARRAYRPAFDMENNKAEIAVPTLPLGLGETCSHVNLTRLLEQYSLRSNRVFALLVTNLTSLVELYGVQSCSKAKHFTTVTIPGES